MTSPSSHDCSMRLRQLLYGILLQEIPGVSSHDVTEISEQASEVCEFDRQGKTICKNFVKPVFHATNEADALPRPQDIVNLSIEERLRVLLACLEIKEEFLLELRSFAPEGLHLFCLATVYFVNHCSPVVKDACVQALLLTVVKLYILNDVTHGEVETGAIGSAQGSSCCFNKAVKRQANQALQKFYKSEYFSRKNLMCVETVHSLAQFQSCLFHAQMLNQVLLLPLSSPDPSRLMNGSFFYNGNP